MLFRFPTNYEIERIEPDLVQILNLYTDPIFQFFPRIAKQASSVKWSISEAVTGLQNIRGYDGDPVPVNRPGEKWYNMMPGVYGDVIPISEEEMTERSAMALAGMPVSIDDLVADANKTLLIRENTLIRSILWTMVRTGEIKVSHKNGTVMQRDSWAIKTYAATTPWSTTATATPSKNFIAARAAWSGGTSCQFDENAVAFMNRKTCDNMLMNTNADDLGTLQKNGNILDLEIVNRKLRALGLPSIQVMNDTYYDNAGTLQYYVPDSTVVVFGTRPANQPLGNYVDTLNMVRTDRKAGGYTFVKMEQNEVPPKVEVHRGHNGGPRILYPNGVGVMSV